MAWWELSENEYLLKQWIQKITSLKLLVECKFIHRGSNLSSIFFSEIFAATDLYDVRKNVYFNVLWFN